MTTEITLAAYQQALFALLDETFENVSGIFLDKGTSLYETLETISAEEASRPVSASCACIAAQVEHVSFYLDVLARYARGEEVGTVDWQASWQRTGVTPDEWSDLKGQLRESYRQTRSIYETDDTWARTDAIEDSMAVVIHTAYHLGEIRQALCTIKG